MRADDGGAFWNIAAGAAIGAAINVVSQIAGNIIDGESIGKGVLMAAATVSGGFSGFIGGNGMRHESGEYYKVAQRAKSTAQKVFSKKYSNTNTPTKLLNRAINTVRSVGYKESLKTGGKFAIGSGLGQVITRGWLW